MVLFVIDALRADRVGPSAATPALDGLAATGVAWEAAFAPAAWTLPSVASLLTGTHPQTHRVLRHAAAGEPSVDALHPDLVTIAEVYRAAGWRTGALVKNPWLTPEHGFDHGFDEFEFVRGAVADGESGIELTGAARAWIASARRREEPFFLYLHYMDPHTPYRPPGRDLAPEDGRHARVARWARGLEVPTPEEVARTRDLYDAEVATVDGCVGDLLEVLGPEAIVAVVADHGEQLGDHGGWLHQDLWDENARVPMVVRAPGLEPGRRAELASSLDLGATLLDLSGLAAPVAWQGRSLLRGEPRGAVFTEYAGDRAVRSGDRALLVGAGGPRLYDLALDPAETVDVADREPEVVRALVGLLEEHERATRAAAPGRPVPGVPMAAEQAGILRELGYLDP